MRTASTNRTGKAPFWLPVALLVMLAAVSGDDSGFRPDPQGFSFENYGNADGIINLTPAEIVRMFGPAARAGGDGDDVELVPAAQEWMDQTNSAMDGGHCEGLAVLSYLFHIHQLNPSDFGAESVHDLKLEGNEALQREIAYWWATQMTETTHRQEYKLTPVEVLDRLRDGLADNAPDTAYSIGIYKPDGSDGHAMTPFAITDVDDKISHIMIYDNNFPDQERFVEVDREANTWKYTTATNPNEPTSEYTGDASTKSLTITPCAVRMGTQVADFLANAPWADEEGLTKPQEDGIEPGAKIPQEEGEAKDPMVSSTSELANDAEGEYSLEITLSGEGADLLITAPDGKRLGFDGNVLVNEIPGASVILPRGGTNSKGAALLDDDVEPRYMVPGGAGYIVRITGTTGTEEPVEVSCLGPGTELVVEDISLEPGQVDEVFFSSDGSRILYQPGGEEHPTLIAGYQADGADYEILARGVEASPGAMVELEIAYEYGCATVQVHESTVPAGVEIQVDRYGDEGLSTFWCDDLELAAGDVAYFHFASWDGDKSPMEVDLDRGGDGEIDEEIQYLDEK